MNRLFTAFFCLLPLMALPATAQYSPYFVTYDHHMEEPGNLEITTQATVGIQKHDLSNYWAPLLEFEYGATGWWSTSLYLEGASAPDDATVFTGYRLENRFKPLKRDHWINPVFYFEFENINEASRIQKEIVGHAEPTSESLSSLRGVKARELEGKLILSSNAKGLNIAENFIIEKNLTEEEGVEFGYALGVYRPLATLASGTKCRFCRENFTAGLELYGGLGSTEQFGLSDTAHYLAPALAWRASENSTIRFSPGFGLTTNSARTLLRFSYTYEISGFGHAVSNMIRGGK
jgi:hypothetical protein